MQTELYHQILQQNPWLKDKSYPIISTDHVIKRVQTDMLLDPEWDPLWTVLIGPRRAGKTTLGKLVAKALLDSGRYTQLLYLNCDVLSIRQWLSNSLFISEAIERFDLKRPILFIDEVQRIKDPGLLLKSVIDLGLPVKHIATGSSQLEIKSQVQEFLTGRQLSSVILPLSYLEWRAQNTLDEVLIYGCYAQVLQSRQKAMQLNEIFQNYIQKDIIEILKIGLPDTLQRLIGLIAHSTGQLVNYNQLATDCQVSTTTIKNQLEILEQTFVITKVKPFVGNKRTEITHNPIYYFIDNGFRNTALRNYSPITDRADNGLLVESFIFQELYKLRTQYYYVFDIYFWRTKSGAEVDFVAHKNTEQFIPIGVKYQSFKKPTVSKGFRSFINAYSPQKAIIITKNLTTQIQINDSLVYFIALTDLDQLLTLVKQGVQ